MDRYESKMCNFYYEGYFLIILGKKVCGVILLN